MDGSKPVVYREEHYYVVAGRPHSSCWKLWTKLLEDLLRSQIHFAFYS